MTFLPLGFCQHVAFRFSLTQQGEYAGFIYCLSMCLVPLLVYYLFILVFHLTTELLFMQVEYFDRFFFMDLHTIWVLG